MSISESEFATALANYVEENGDAVGWIADALAARIPAEDREIWLLEIGAVSPGGTESPQPPTVRPIEMFIMWPDKTWSDGEYVNIPINTPDDEIESAARAELSAQYTKTEVANFGVHSIPGQWRDHNDNLWELDVNDEPFLVT